MISVPWRWLRKTLHLDWLYRTHDLSLEQGQHFVVVADLLLVHRIVHVVAAGFEEEPEEEKGKRNVWLDAVRLKVILTKEQS